MGRNKESSPINDQKPSPRPVVVYPPDGLSDPEAYTHGTTLVESGIATSTLLRYVTLPDSTGSSDRVEYTYNRQGERMNKRE